MPGWRRLLRGVFDLTLTRKPPVQSMVTNHTKTDAVSSCIDVVLSASFPLNAWGKLETAEQLQQAPPMEQDHTSLRI